MDVVVGFDHATITGILAQGQSVPAPAICHGLIDTGTDVTAISPSLANRLSLTLAGQVSTNTASRRVDVNVYSVSLSITDTAAAQRQSLHLSTLQVTELPANLPTADVLIGLDVLLGCRLVVDGPARQFMLEF